MKGGWFGVVAVRTLFLSLLLQIFRTRVSEGGGGWRLEETPYKRLTHVKTETKKLIEGMEQGIRDDVTRSLSDLLPPRRRDHGVPVSCNV